MDRRLLLTMFLLGLNLAGCGSASNGRFPVSGQVTLHGTPLATGSIVFESKDGSQRGGTTVEEGRYSIPAELGLLPGMYVVRISAVESSQKASTSAPPGPESMGAEQFNRELIPAEFNKDSKVTHEVGSGKSVTLDVKIP